MDCQQTQLAIEGEQDKEDTYIMQDVHPREQRALSIQIPPLAEGVHRLTIVYVPDVWL